ncbi:MAG: hypothetical protein ACI86M_000941 [Saprospiraceae bacterium]
MNGVRSTELDSTTTNQYYLARSGNFKRDSFYLLGVLEFQDPELAIEQFINLKEVHNYKSKISYNSNDTFKIPIAKALIDLFVNSNIKLTSVLDVQNISDNSSDFKLKLDAIKRLLGDNFSGSIVTKNESYFSPSTSMRENFSENIGGQMISERTDNSLLLQFADLINGCVYGSISGKVTNKTKVEINEYFRSAIGVSQFLKGTAVQDKLYII